MLNLSGRKSFLSKYINCPVCNLQISLNFSMFGFLNNVFVCVSYLHLVMVLITRFCKSTKRERLDVYVAAQTILQYWKYGYTREKYDKVRNKDLRMIPIAFEILVVILVICGFQMRCSSLLTTKNEVSLT